MRLAGRGAVWLAFCYGIVCSTAGMSQATSSANASGVGVVSGSGGSSSAPGVSGSSENAASVLSAPSVLVTAGSPVEGEQAQAAERAALADPVVVAEREASSTRFEGLDGEQAMKVVGEAFPGFVGVPEGGPPQLAVGERITGYGPAGSARVELPGGERGLIESVAPMAVEASPGRFVPIDLGLSEVSGGFGPRTPLVGVRIPKRLGEGVQVAGVGVSLTPLNAQGSALGGSEGVLDGVSVFYGDTGTDSDTLAKPTTGGFELASMLRSELSPQTLFFRVGMPEGATLQASSSGGAEVLRGGVVIAMVEAPAAVDAAGQAVSASMSVSGDTLAIALSLGEGEYEFPVMLDPSVVTDTTLAYPGNWTFKTNDASVFEGKAVEGLRDQNQHSNVHYENGEYGYFEYPTQGASRIYAFTASMKEVNKSSSLALVDEIRLETNGGMIESGLGEEGKAVIKEPAVDGDANHENVKICAEASCGPVSVSGSEGNSALFWQKVSKEEGLSESFSYTLRKASVEIEQEKEPTASFDTTDATIEGQPNALLSGKWYKSSAVASFGVSAEDPGIGIQKESLSSSSKSGWGYALKNEARNECSGAQCNRCYQPSCLGKASGNGKALSYALAAAEGGELPEGEDKVEAKVEDAVGLKATATGTIKLDDTPPHSLSVSGLPSTHELADGQHVALKGSATDAASGIASIALMMDGQSVGGPNGSCSGSCTAHGEWTLNGENYASGQYTLEEVATDNAGNVETASYEVTIRHAWGVGVGPGSVNPVTGELGLSATDVSVSVPGATLAVTRGYRSRHLAEGTEGPLGPQWIISVGAQASLSRSEGGMVLTGSEGGQTVFASKGGGEFSAPANDTGVSLAEKVVEGKAVFLLSENGAVTTFALPVGSSGGVWVPSVSEEAGGTNQTTFSYQLAGGVIEPTEVLAPISKGVSCGKPVKERKEALEQLKPGCRALVFEYAKTTTATGENSSKWGDFAGHLSKVAYVAWSASTKAMAESVEAQYLYDGSGRLRAVWNPEVSPALKTTYGYDSEGHVTAISAPGEQPWLLSYGTDSADVSPGRLLAATLPAASTALGSGNKPESTEAPTLSSTKPVVGTKISVNLNSEKTPGKWAQSPLAFSYQWDDCDTSGKECAPIPGAVNGAYYPVSSDEGHELVAQVVALNATGAVTVTTAATGTVAAGTASTPLPEPPYVGTNSVWTLEYGLPVSGSGAPYKLGSSEIATWGQVDNPAEAMAVFPPDKVMGWPAKEYVRETVHYLDSKDREVNTATPTGGITTREFNPYNEVTRSLSADNRVTALKETCESGEKCKSAEVAKTLDTESTYEEKGSEPGTELLSTLGPQHTVELTNGTQVEARQHKVYFYNEAAPKEGGPYHLVTKLTEGAIVAGKEEPESVRTTTTSYSGSGSQEDLGWKLRKPISVITDPNGLDLVHTTEYEPTTGNVTETKPPAVTGKNADVPPVFNKSTGKKGTTLGKFESPDGITVNLNSKHEANEWIVDRANNRLAEINPSGDNDTNIADVGFGVTSGAEAFQRCTSGCKAGKAGSGNGQFSSPAGIASYDGELYVADYGNDRVEVLNEKGEYVSQFGKKGASVEQMEGPESIAINSSGDVFVGDRLNNRIDEYTSAGKFIEAFGYGVTNGEGKLQTCTSTCRAGLTGSNNGEFSELQGVAITGTDVYVTDYGNNRIQEFSEAGAYLTKFGTKGTGSGQFEGPTGIATDPVTEQLYVIDKGNERVEVFSNTGAYAYQFGVGSEGGFAGPEGIMVEPEGQPWIVDTGNDRVERWWEGVAPGEGQRDTKTVYYSAEASSEYPVCGKHPEWAGMVCRSGPAEPLGTTPLESTFSYNMWGEPTSIEEANYTFVEPRLERAKTNTYDAAGRLKTTAVSVGESAGKPLPTVTYSYTAETGAETGALTSQSTTSGGKTQKISSAYNTRGQITGYTDAAETTSTFEYDLDGRLRKMSDGKGTQTYEYSTTTGLLGELIDSSHEGMKFTATYDAEGNMLTEHYPNGMNAIYAYNATSTPVSLEYKKLTNCTEEKEKCRWFTDNIVPSIHGQWMAQTSSLSKEGYTYDAAGRLTKVEDTPTGQGCITRLYSYDEDGDRTSLTAREPNVKKECAIEGGTTEHFLYGSGDQLTGLPGHGVTYNEFGDVTKLPEEDAGGSELESSYYADNQVASQTQKEQTVSYNLDPAERTLETVSTGSPKVSDVISHYAGPGNEPSWTETVTPKEWTRNIPGINGQLAAVQNNGEAPVLQMANLQGDLVATAYLSETATELASKVDTTEYGVPTTTLPPKYSWLGAIELPTELPSGVTNMGARSYVPQIGRFLQPDPIPGGSADAYSYTFDDPVDTSDPTGEYTATTSAGVSAAAEEEADRNFALGYQEHQERVQRELAEKAAAEAAARAAAEAAANAATAGPQYEEEEWWYEEEEYGWEYISSHYGGITSNEEAHVEPAILVQPLVSESQAHESEQRQPGAVRFCEDGVVASCSRDAGGVGHAHGKRLVRALNHDYPEKGLSGCAKALIGYGALGTATDLLSPGKALAACAIGEVLG